MKTRCIAVAVLALAPAALGACGTTTETKTVTAKAATPKPPPDLRQDAALMARVEAETEREYRANLKSKVDTGSVASGKRTRTSLKTFSCTPESATKFTCNARVILKIYVDGYCQQNGGYYEITGTADPTATDDYALVTDWAASDSSDDDEFTDCF